MAQVHRGPMTGRTVLITGGTDQVMAARLWQVSADPVALTPAG
jgi:hypothetical protein